MSDKKVKKCAVALVTDALDRVVLVFNRKRGALELPGGGVEEGETPYAAVKREFYEETTLRAESLESRVIRGIPKPGADYESEIHVFYGRIEAFDLGDKARFDPEIEGVSLLSKRAVRVLHARGALSDLDSTKLLLVWAEAIDPGDVEPMVPTVGAWDEGGGP